MKLKYFSLVLLSVFCFVQSALPQNAQAQTLIAQNIQDSIGTVTAVQAGSFVLRDGQKIPLETESSIQEKDTIITDYRGKVQITLNDGTKLAFAHNTNLLIDEFTTEATKPVIRASLSQGLVHSITGAIVEQNPDGFAMTTPQASIAIRGTTFAVEHENDSTATYVFNTEKQLLVNGLEIPSGKQHETVNDKTIPITKAAAADIHKRVSIANSLNNPS